MANAAIADPREGRQSGRVQIGMVADISSERWPASRRNAWPVCLVGRSRQPLVLVTVFVVFVLPSVVVCDDFVIVLTVPLFL
jgi:hypothetical protein